MVTAPTAPTKVGHTFEGWYSDAGLSNDYTFSTPITGHTSLYAEWESYMEAEASVAITEIYQTQHSVNTAYSEVMQLIDNMKRTELLNRILAVQAIIDSITIEIDDIVRLIYSGTSQEKDINQDSTFDQLDVHIMLQRISAPYPVII